MVSGVAGVDRCYSLSVAKALNKTNNFLTQVAFLQETSNSTRKYLKNMIVWTVHWKRKKNINPWSTAVCVELMEDPTTRGDCLMSITVRKKYYNKLQKIKERDVKKTNKISIWDVRLIRRSCDSNWNSLTMITLSRRTHHNYPQGACVSKFATFSGRQCKLMKTINTKAMNTARIQSSFSQ